MSAQINVDEGTEDLRMCCGQLLAINHEHEHTLCDSKEDAYSMGGLSIELERCPHGGCGARFFSPGQNLQHQDSMHRAILSYVCGVSQGIYVMEGAFICHVIQGQGRPEGFESDMNKRHGAQFGIKVPYTF